MRSLSKRQVARLERERKITELAKQGIEDEKIAEMVGSSLSEVKNLRPLIVRKISEAERFRKNSETEEYIITSIPVTIKGVTYMDITGLIIDCGNTYRRKK